MLVWICPKPIKIRKFCRLCLFKAVVPNKPCQASKFLIKLFELETK